MGVFRGTSSNDSLRGTSGRDSLYGLAGNDALFGGDGDDQLYYQVGGNDRLYGEDGNDRFNIYGPELNAVVYTVRAFGGAGDDSLVHIDLDRINILFEGGTGTDSFSVAFGNTLSNYTVDLSEGNDRLMIGDYTNRGDGNYTVSLGAGADDVLIFAIPTTLTISDFEAGAGGDRFVFVDLFAFSGFSIDQNPFSTGHLALSQNGNDVHLWQDIDGSQGGQSAQSVGVMQNTTISALTAENFAGYDPLGGNVVGQTYSFQGLATTHMASNGDDVISLSDPTSTVYGLGGDDVITGSSGRDNIYGGHGNDVVNAGEGNDWLYIETGGNDILYGEGGNDIFRVSNTSIAGATEFYTFSLYGEAGNDQLIHIDTAAHRVLFSGGTGDDVATIARSNIASVHNLNMGAGDDLVNIGFGGFGGEGRINITTGTGSDVVNIGTLGFGFQTVSVPLPSQITIKDFTAGVGGDTVLMDFAEFISNWDGVENPFNIGAARLEQQGNNTVLMFEQFQNKFGNVQAVAWTQVVTFENTALTSFVFENFGSSDVNYLSAYGPATQSDDILVGSSGEDSLTGLNGNDRLEGYEGDDILQGGDGSDTLNGGDGNDYLFADHLDTLGGGEGYDRVIASASSLGLNIDMGASTVEFVRATKYTDVIDASTALVGVYIDSAQGHDTLTGSAHNDRFFAGSGNDVVNAGAGDDIIDGHTGADTLTGGGGNDVFYVDHLDTLDGGAGYDRLFVRGYSADTNFDLGAAGIEYASGSVANDTFDASSASVAVKLIGRTGEDVLSGGSSADQLYGGVGNDVLNGGAGNDLLNAAQGADSLSGGAGDDKILINSDDTFIDGGDGYDRVYVHSYSSGVTLDLAAANIEYVYGSGAGDIFTAVGANAAVKMLGQGGGDTLTGGSANDQLFGGAGQDILTGGAGDDYMSGGAGTDSFIFAAGFGNDKINDFDTNSEVLDMSALGITLADLSISALGGSTLIEYGANSIVLLGVDVATIDASDFSF